MFALSAIRRVCWQRIGAFGLRLTNAPRSKRVSRESAFPPLADRIPRKRSCNISAGFVAASATVPAARAVSAYSNDATDGPLPLPWHRPHPTLGRMGVVSNNLWVLITTPQN